MKVFISFLWENYRGPTLLVTFLALVNGILDGLTMMLLIPLLSLLGVEQSQSSIQRWVDQFLGFLHVGVHLWSVLGLLFFVAVTVTLLQRVYQILEAKIEIKIVDDLRTQSFEGAFKSQWLFFQKHTQAELTNLIFKECERVGLLFNLLTLAVSMSLISTAYILWSFNINWKMALTVMAGAAGLMLILKSRVVRGYRSGQNISAMNQSLFSAMSDFLSSAKIIKASAREGVASGHFSKTSKEWAHETLLYRFNTTYIKTVMEPLAIGFLCLLIWVGKSYLQMPGADLLVILLIFQRTMPRVKEFQIYWNEFLLNLPGFEAVKKFLSEIRENREVENKNPLTFNGFESIELRDVSFSYSGREGVLNHLQFILKKGECLGIAGTSGGGKTTLVDTIIGLITPSTGEVLLNQKNIGQFSLEQWRQKIGYVAQEPLLINGTLKENLLYFAEDRENIKLLEQVCEDVGLTDFIQNLPKGYQTIIGDRGTQLSGGQRQRIAIVRALLMKPEILILDEASSSLDNESEKLIQKSIELLKGKISIITIAHRLSTLQFCDRIIVLEKGSVVQEGPWVEISQNTGRFKDLLLAQSQSEGKGHERSAHASV